MDDWCDSMISFFKKGVNSNNDLRQLLQLTTNTMQVVSKISLNDLSFCKTTNLANTLQEMVLQEVLYLFSVLSSR